LPIEDLAAYGVIDQPIRLATDPAFVHLVPYPVSLMSKILFELAAAAVFRVLDASARDARQALFARHAVHYR
jgi:hypothetical protein